MRTSIRPPTAQPNEQAPVNLAVEALSLQLFTASAPDPVLITSPKHKIWYANPAWEKLTGYRLANVQNLSLRQLNSSKLYRRAYQQAVTHLAMGKPYATDVLANQRPDGSFYSIHIAFFPITLSKQTVLYVQLQHDLTLQLEQQQQNHLNAKLINNVHDAIIGINTDLSIISWNPAAEKLYGYKPEEILGKSIMILVPTHAREQLLKRLTGPSAKKELVNLATERTTKDGRIIHVLISKTPIINSHGHIEGFTIIHHDLTPKKVAAEILQQSQNLHEELLNMLAEAAITFNRDHQIIFANSYTRQMFGYTKSEFTKLHLEDLCDPQDLATNPTLIDEALTGHTTYTERLLRRKDGTIFPAEISSHQLNKNLVQSIVRDITERKQKEAQRDTFIGIAAHELKTPITAIKAYTQLLKTKLTDPADPELKRYLQSADQQVDRLTTLVNDLLDVNRIESGNLTLHRKTQLLDPTLKKIINAYKRTLTSHNITVHGQTGAYVNADFKRLEQVMTNLLANAIKYSPNSPQIIVHLQTRDRHAIISIQDFGVGISKTDQPKIFQRFYRANEKRAAVSGFGLGLYIASQIIEQHGGHIWVKSQPGNGSTFYFSLPIVDAPAKKA